MTPQQEAAMRQMIEVLEENHHLIEEHERPEYLAHYDRVISAGRQALEQQPADEPVALQMDVIVGNLVREGINKHRARELAEHFIKHTSPQPADEPFGYFRYDLRLDAWVQSRDSNQGTPFYTRPQPAAWVGLTDEEVFEFATTTLATFSEIRAIEAKLREKNGGKA